MNPLNPFRLLTDPVTGEPFEDSEPRPPLDPSPNKSDPLTTRKAKAIIRRHIKGGAK